MNSNRVTTVTLRALEGAPLSERHVRDMVVATAQAIAERQGIEVLRVAPQPDAIAITLQAGRIEAIGLAAELRRLTTSWYTHKFGVDTLWGDIERDDPDETWLESDDEDDQDVP